MASSGPPGVDSPHPSLPARPPPLTAGYGPSAPPVTTYGTGSAPPSAAPAHQPKLGYSRTYAPVGGAGGYPSQNHSTGYSASYQQPTSSYGPSMSSGSAAAASYWPQYGASYNQQASPGTSVGPQSYGPQSYGPQAYGPQAYGPSAPQIQNPFPAQGPQPPQGYQQGYAGGAGRGGYRQNNAGSYGAWQQGAATGAASHSASYGPTAAAGAYGAEAVVAEKPAAPAGQDGAEGETGDKPHSTHTVYRSGGGKTWTDDTLLEWDPNHPRLFVGNLAGEVTDDTLFKAFSRWKSVQKAAVKRDKWTKKSRGYGFVSFSDADDFFQAAKEMNGKYIGSHPVVVRKSTTEIKVSAFKDESGGDRHGKNKKKNHGSHGKGGGEAGAVAGSGTSTPMAGAGAAGSGSGGQGSKPGYAPALGPVSTGVQKHKKKKNGLKLLG